MQRRALITELENYRKHVELPEELDILVRMEKFVRDNPHCFLRENLAGHVTGSALVVNADLSRVLLTLHKKLGKWLQLGGHSDGHPLVHEVALKEAEEESGLHGFKFFRDEPIPFDLDIHEIPGRPDVPRHLHYDVRYLLVTDDQVPLRNF